MAEKHKEAIGNSVDQIRAKNFNQANKELTNTINDKLADRLDQERAAIASRLYGGESEVQQAADENDASDAA